MNRSNNAAQKTSSAASNARSAISNKPSQWLCKSCGFTNLATNSKCACGAYKNGSYTPKNSGAACKGGICQISDQ